MAIAYDTSVDGGLNPSDSTTWQWNHTCTGTDRILFVSFFGDATDYITGVTYNSVSMTEVGKVASGVDRYNYLYVLHAPATGSNQVQITASQGIRMAGSSVSYTGAEQTSTVDNSTTNTGNTVTTLTTSLTPTVNNCWTILGVRSPSEPISSTGSTLRESSNGHGSFDSNGAITPAASYSMTVTHISGFPAHVMASFAPVTPIGGFMTTNPGYWG